MVTATTRSGYRRRRDEMVEDLRTHGAGERVLAAMAEVPRERFVPTESRDAAYDRSPLQIGTGQTISAPRVVAAMIDALGLTGTERVLEIGGGSGYGAAVLSRCAADVVTVEYHPELADAASRVLAGLAYDNVEVRCGDGHDGAPDRAPFDAIAVTAMAHREIPPALLDQLAGDGVLVCPVGSHRDNGGELVRRREGRTETLMPVTFVPLIRSS